MDPEVHKFSFSCWGGGVGVNLTLILSINFTQAIILSSTAIHFIGEGRKESQLGGGGVTCIAIHNLAHSTRDNY